MVAWTAFVISFLGLVLNAKQKILCWPVWIFSNGLWIYHSIQIEEWAAVTTWVLFTFGNIYGWIQWHKKTKPTEAERVIMDMIAERKEK